ncbi:RNA-binding protein [Crassaminicella profunda]|uniref:YlmH family RNA-binding protein n=1 Tax=Crassaminicella profunda TaxID=1286698 RepID=UPI001CA70188|nr:YlmH/Sll1252 family protein [Crassaminicella profunda]QZY57138.1 RNA-binding protein [Crassaminicella profunda]
MINKESLTKHIKNTEERYVVMKTLNKVESVLKSHGVRVTDFYNPYEISLCIPILNQILDINYLVVGGYENAERRVIIIYPEYMEISEEEYPIGAIKVSGRFMKDELTHRDFLGAVLGLGLKREKIGDILVGDGQANIIAHKELCDYILLNLEKVSKFKINIERIYFNDLMKVEENFKIIQGSVSALRLDSILGTGFGESRNAISKLINNDRVKVNFKPVNQPSYILHEGDLISFKGKGRIILDQIGNKTKKDRYKVIIKRIV